MSDRVLLTGVSGFLGGHVALELLKQGHVVRGSLRDPARAEGVRAALGAAGADVRRLEFVALDLANDDGWDAAMVGVRFLHHIASPFFVRAPADRMSVIGPAVAGTERALAAALKAGVERVVLTSSMAAMAYGHGRRRTAPVTADDWTELSGAGVTAYIEAKTRAERRAWEVMAAAGRRADLVAVNPGVIFGPLLDADPGESVGLLRRLFDGSTPALPRLSVAVVDVRDVAAFHVLAMTRSEAGGNRFALSAGTRALKEIVETLRAGLPAHAARLPRRVAPDWLVRLIGLFDADARGNLDELGRRRELDARPAVRLLGRDLITPEVAALAAAKSLVAHALV